MHPYLSKGDAGVVLLLSMACRARPVGNGKATRTRRRHASKIARKVPGFIGTQMISNEGPIYVVVHAPSCTQIMLRFQIWFLRVDLKGARQFSSHEDN